MKNKPHDNTLRVTISGTGFAGDFTAALKKVFSPTQNGFLVCCNATEGVTVRQAME